MNVSRSNVLIAFANLVAKTQLELYDASVSTNRVNQMGESLETYVKDLFCDSFELNAIDKQIQYEEKFSYLGNQNNPPDIMLRGGDAIEVKKIENPHAALALNSSHPKDVLHSDDPKINARCKNAEAWTVKDMIYVVGHVEGSQLKSLWFVSGDCYAAKREFYARASDIITSSISQLSDSDINLGQTKELGRLNNVDPLGATHLRIRGMWGISNPAKFFDYITGDENQFANLILLRQKYESFPEEDRKLIESLVSESFQIKDVQIKDPNDPMRLLDAKLLSFKLLV